MSTKNIMPEVKIMINIGERHRLDLTDQELRALHRLKTWVREKEEEPISAAKAKGGNSRLRNLDRGIAI